MSKRNREIADMAPKTDKNPKKACIEDINVEDDPELETKMISSASSLLSDIFSDKVVDDKEVSKALLFLTMNLRSKFKTKFEVYDEKLDGLSEKIKELEIRNNALEANLVAKDLIFRKVPLHPNAVNESETPDQTKEQVKAIFTDLKMNLQDFEFPETIRARKKKDFADKTKFSLIIVRFPFATHIRILFEQMKKELPNSAQFSALSVDKSIPRCMEESYSAASAKAHELRIKRKWRTKIEVEGGAVVLKTRSRTSTTWTVVPPNKWALVKDKK